MLHRARRISGAMNVNSTSLPQLTETKQCQVIRKKAQKGAVLKSQQEKENEYCFDEAFGEDSTQDEVYQGTAAKHVLAVLEGINVTVIAYGATGAGSSIQFSFY
jgi:hypothetical protein